MKPHCGFDLNFSNNEWCWASFHVFIATCISSLKKCLSSSLAHFLTWLFIFLVLSYMSCLYILEITYCQLLPLIIFSPILRAVFSPCLSLPSFCKAFKFNSVPFVYFCFYLLLREVGHRGFCCDLGWRLFCLCYI